MSEILRDPIWQFIGAILAALAIIVAIALYLKGRKVKSFSYDIISQTPLLRVNGAIREKLQIAYEGKPVQQVDLIIVKLLNSGNTPIASSDFEIPITISFGNNAEVFTAEIQKKQPENLQASITIDGNGIVLSRNLLNQGDSVTVKALVTKVQEVSVDGRIIGVREIQKFKSRPEFYTAISAIIFMGIAMVGVIGDTLDPTSSLFRVLFTFSAFVLIGIFGMRSYILRKKTR